MSRNKITGLTDFEATFVMRALGRDNPVLPIKAIDEKDLRTRILIISWLLAEERRRPNFLVGALLKVSTVGGYIPRSGVPQIIAPDYKTGSGNPDFRDQGGRVMHILDRTSLTIRTMENDHNAHLFVRYHNLNDLSEIIENIETYLYCLDQSNGQAEHFRKEVLRKIENMNVPFERHYPQDRFNRKVNKLLAEQCEEVYEKLSPKVKEDILIRIEKKCPCEQLESLYEAIENETVQFSISLERFKFMREVTKLRVTTKFQDTSYEFEMEIDPV